MILKYTGVLFLLLLAAAALMGGCGGPVDPFATERHPISGFVQYDGKPLYSGEIVLIPAEGTSGPKASTKIESGVFAIPQESGPLPGKYRVEIRATNPAEPDPDDTAAVEKFIREQQARKSSPLRIPDRYNRSSQLQQEIVPGSENDWHFELTSKP